MRAVYLESHGNPESVIVGERPDAPPPGPGEVRVKLAYAGLNRVDLYMRGGGAGFPHELPFILGVDGAGVVDAVGEGVDHLKRGDRVALYPARTCGRCEFCRRGDQMLCLSFLCIGENIDGSFAELITVKADQPHRLPDHVPLEHAAAMGTAYLTAFRMVMTRGQVAATDTVLIHGIGGGASLAALQFARMHGARAIVTSSSDAKLERALALGAWAGVNYTRENVLTRVKELTAGRGADLVVENVGAATWPISMRAVVRGGRIVCCGATTGGMPGADLQRLFFRQIQVSGVTIGTQDEFRALLSALERGLFEPVVDHVYPLADARVALERLDRGQQFGKLMLEIAGER